MHEIVSLQFGHRSNYVATHFWNIQESYFTYSDKDRPAIDHDVHFRGGIGVDGAETFTPRTVIYDLKGGFGSLRKYNALYELSEEDTLSNSLWQGNALTQKQPVIEPNDYQKSLEQGLPTSQLTGDQVRYWSDFNRVFYHPRSIVQLNEYELNSQLMPFENWNTGHDLFNDLEKASGLFDRDVRLFAEECDQLAGIQIFTSTDDAWGGFTSSYADVLRDEFGKTSIWLWGLEDAWRVDRQAKLRRTANVARCLQAMAPEVSAYIRLSSPPSSIPGYIELDTSSEWSKSSLLCTAVETVTLPTRLREGNGRPGSLADLESSLNNTGSRTIFELGASVVKMDGTITQPSAEKPLVDAGHGSLLPTVASTFNLDYSPRGSHTTLGRKPQLFSQVEVRRCMPGKHIPITSGGSNEQDQDALVEIYPTFVAFPQLDAFPATVLGPSSQSLAIRAALTTTSETSYRLRDMGQLIGRAIEVENRENLLNNLAELGEAYEIGWQSSSESAEGE